MNYFVTGATGFIGRHLVAELLERDGTIHALVREGSRGKLDALAQRLDAPEGKIVAVAGDLSKPGLGVENFDQPIDHLFHLVGELERWMKEGKLDNVSPGEPEMSEPDVQSFLQAGVGR